METRVENLKKGDEIIFAKGSLLVYARLLETPRLSKTKRSWRTKQLEYINVKCSMKNDSSNHTYNISSGRTHTYFVEEYSLSPNDHDTIKKINLNRRRIWLVKEAKELI